METVTDIFLHCKNHMDQKKKKNHMDSDHSHEIKRHWLLGRKAVTNLDSILKGRDISLPTDVCIVKAMVFPVVI